MKVLHHWGVCGNCSGGQSNFVVPVLGSGVSGYTLRGGDRLVFLQKQTNARAGLYLIATDGSNSMGSLTDGSGDWVNSSSVADGAWHQRSVDLSGWSGKQIGGNVGVSVEANTPSGVNWDSQIADVAVLSTDGSVHTMMNGNTAEGTAWNPSAGANFETLRSNDGPPIVHYFAQDHLGTSQMELSITGYPVWKGEFAPFGQELSDPAATAGRYKFTGKERDAESGLDYFGARYYAGNQGRWLSPDWADKPEAVPYSDLTDPQSLNLYGYVRNNPLSRVDKDGHCFPWCFALAGGGALEAEAPLAAAGPIGWAVIGVTAAGVVGYAAYQHFHQEAATPAAAPEAKEDSKPPVVVVDGAKHPESAQHVAGAQAAGHPTVVTIDRPGAKGRRTAATSGTKTEPGKHRDEYPPAVTAEGGQGASVQNIGASDNTGSGASLGNQLRQYPNGTQVEIKPINVPKPPQ